MNLSFDYPLQQNANNILRQCGYSPIRDFHTKKNSYVRTLSSQKYPRFHIYILEESTLKTRINLHLDMKFVSYEGQSAHSGEYDSENVIAEGKRISHIFKENTSDATTPERPPKPPSKISFFR